MTKIFCWILTGLCVASVVLSSTSSLAFDSEEGKWTRKADMPTARLDLSTSTVDGIIYAIGGTTVTNVTEWGGDFIEVSTVEAYDPRTDTWAKKTDMPTPRAGVSTSVIDGKIYALGGVKRDKVYKALPTVEVYDPATDTWTEKTDMPTARHSLATSVVDGKIYAVGGLDSSYSGLSAVEVYDPVTDSWTSKADMPSARGMLSASVVDGVIYVVGGAPALDFAYPVIEAYDPQTDTWAKKASPPTLRVGLSTNAVNGMVYAFGGIVWQKNDGSWICTSEVIAYDPKTDVWTKETDMPSPRYGFSTSIFGGKVYLIGGDDEGYTAFSLVEEYEYPTAR